MAAYSAYPVDVGGPCQGRRLLCYPCSTGSAAHFASGLAYGMGEDTHDRLSDYIGSLSAHGAPVNPSRYGLAAPTPLRSLPSSDVPVVKGEA